MLEPAGGHTRLHCFASVVGSVRPCTGTEGATSSKFGCANVNDRLKRLKDTILIYLFLTSFLPMHSMHCPTPCACHASPTVPPARPMHVSRMHWYNRFLLPYMVVQMGMLYVFDTNSVHVMHNVLPALYAHLTNLFLL